MFFLGHNGDIFPMFKFSRSLCWHVGIHVIFVTLQLDLGGTHTHNTEG